MTGATGYIGGSVAERLLRDGHTLSGLVRSDAGARELERRSILPVPGSLDDADVIAGAARAADAVIDTADANHAGVVEAIASALNGSDKAFLHTSGSGIVGTEAGGRRSDEVYDEYTPFTPTVPRMQQRAAIDQRVFDAARRAVRAVVIRPAMIYGEGRGARKESYQVPALIENAKQNGIGLHIGPGENLWANVHIDDVVELYRLALANAPAGALYYVENGEESLKNVAAAISRMLGFEGRTREWSAQDAQAALGPKAHSSFGSNSRVRGRRSRAELGWNPHGATLTEEIEHGWYRRVQGR